MDRIEISIKGDLPDDSKFATLASAQTRARALAEELNKEHGLTLVASVKPVRPSKKTSAPIVQAVTLAPEPMRLVRD